MTLIEVKRRGETEKSEEKGGRLQLGVHLYYQASIQLLLPLRKAQSQNEPNIADTLVINKER